MLDCESIQIISNNNYNSYGYSKVFKLTSEIDSNDNDILRFTFYVIGEKEAYITFMTTNVLHSRNGEYEFGKYFVSSLFFIRIVTNILI